MLQSKIVLGFIIFIGFALGFLYYTQTSEVAIDTDTTPIDSNLGYFDSVRLDFSIFEDERYKVLDIYGEIPVDPGVTGRRNIFAPVE